VVTRAPIRVELTLHPDVLLDEAKLRDAAASAARVKPKEVADVRLVRRTIDARHGKVRVIVLADVALHDGPSLPARTSEPSALPSLSGEPAVVVVGAGPAGLFCAWRLAQLGVRCVLLERGQAVAQRRHDVAKLSQRGELDVESNYCFGEGGAGTFSDGKLYTRASKRGSVEEVLEAFVAYGAPADVLVNARPHIGTNRLPKVVGALRAHLESAGQRVVFGARVDDVLKNGDAVGGVRLADGSTLPARVVVLATGHSAGDVYEWLARAGAPLSFKPFALGVRVEHDQAFIDRTQYGALAGHPALGSAPYRIVVQACGVGVFSFCMCPGGHIVPASTSQAQQVVNGWSPSSRRGRFANSGLVVEVGAQQLKDFKLDPSDAFAGAKLQKLIEQRAYEAGGGAFVAPGQRLDDLRAGRLSTDLPATSYPRGATPARLDRVLGGLGAPLREALAKIDRSMPGFAGHDAIAVGVESRTSAPIRIEREPTTLQSPGLRGLYPCAEGAGYAGGIMSAALDGMRIAEAIARDLR
jgi:uncharacterized FAD-dependent dehydrogenase